MGYAKHIGRVGALAVALGIGSAIASPQIAGAEDDTSTPSRSTSEARSGTSPSPGVRTVRTAGAPDRDTADAQDVDTEPAPAEDTSDDEAETVDETEPDDDTEAAEPAAPAPGESDEVTTELPAANTNRGPAAPHTRRTAPLSVLSAKTTATSPASAAPITRTTTTLTPVSVAAESSTPTAAAAAATAAGAAAAAAAGVPQVSVVVTTKPAQTRPPLRPVRQLVLGVLGVFGFNPNPAPGTSNNPILEGLWGAYRRIESLVSNDTPTVKTAEVVNTSLTTDGRVAVTLNVEFDDYDGNTLSYTTTNGAHGTLTRNTDGTYTYLTDTTTGTDTVSITARDKGFHLHGLLGMFKPGGGHTSTATLALTLAADGQAPVIVISTPGTGDSWTVDAEVRDPQGNVIRADVTADQSDYVTVTRDATGRYLVTVTDAAWALANPGTQITVTATTESYDANGEIHTTSTTLAIGTVSNLMLLGEPDVPALPAGMTWVQADSNNFTSILLRSDGRAFAVGGYIFGTIIIPDLPAGLTYTQVAAGDNHFALLRSDGTAIAFDRSHGTAPQVAWVIPDLPAGLTYTQVAAGANHTVLLRSDGVVIALGDVIHGETTIPALPAGQTYTQISAVGYETALLRSDGTAVAIGIGQFGENDVPAPPAGVTYTQVETGAHHTVLLHSDGTVTAIGFNQFGQLEIPALPEGLTYTQIDAGHYHTVLLRSDGAVITVGDFRGEIPTLPNGVVYTAVSANLGTTSLLFGRA